MTELLILAGFRRGGPQLRGQRGLREPARRSGGVLHLQPQPAGLQLCHRHRNTLLPLQLRLPAAGRLLPPD